MSYLIKPSEDSITRGLESWQWLELKDKTPLFATAFADLFFSAPSGIWFLDTLEGKLKRVFDDKDQLVAALATAEVQDAFLMSPFVDRAKHEDQDLMANQCYDFKLHPVLGGAIAWENITVSDFMVALNLRGQLHDQLRHLAPGTPISEVELVLPKAKKQWWKFW